MDILHDDALRLDRILRAEDDAEAAASDLSRAKILGPEIGALGEGV
jgi:hypothetical protein